MGELLTEHDGGSGVDGEGSRGQSLSRQGARTGTSDPRNLVSDGGGALELFWGNRRLFREF